MTSDTTDLSRLRRKSWRVELLMLGFAVLAFSWIPAGLILIFRDADSRPVFTIFRQLWPLLFFPLCFASVCWLWRSSLKRKIRDMESAFMFSNKSRACVKTPRDDDAQKNRRSHLAWDASLFLARVI